jgi:hypothetical protein
MQDETLNPYAPPTDHSVAAEDPGVSWCVQGGYLLVRPGAMLPPVPLEDDEARGVLTPGVRRFQVITGGVKGMAVAFIPSILGLGWFVYCRMNDLHQFSWLGLVAIIVLSRLFTARAGGAVQVTVGGFLSIAALRRKKRLMRGIRFMMTVGIILLGGTCGALIFDIPTFLSTDGRSSTLDELLAWVGPALIVGLLLIFGAMSLVRFLPGVISSAFRDGWLYLRGVPMTSLVQLEARSREPQPPLRMRKVTKFYQYRLPFRVLLRGVWGHPWLALWLVIFKLTRSQRLVRLQFHWSERTILPVAEADAELRERWTKESAGTPLAGWQAVYAERRDSPQGDLRIEFLTYASPDWQHFACLVVTRISAGNIFSEIRQTTVQSWAADGRFFFTSSPPMVFLLPDYFDAHEVRGPLGAVHGAHLARTAGADLLTIGGKEHLFELYARQSEDIAALYEDRGLQSPPEEMELRDIPA